MELWTSHYFQLLFNLLGNLHRSTYVMQSACSLLTFKPKIILLYGVSLICCLLYFFLVLKFRFFFFFFFVNGIDGRPTREEETGEQKDEVVRGILLFIHKPRTEHLLCSGP